MLIELVIRLQILIQIEMNNYRLNNLDRHKNLFIRKLMKLKIIKGLIK